MRELKDKELMNIDGGSNWFTAAFFNSVARLISTIMDMGRSLGSSLRRISSGSYCSVKE